VTVLLDSNVLIALVIEEHVHHSAAETWLTGSRERFATCPLTQGSLVRFLVRDGLGGAAAVSVVAAIESNDRHEFWSDELSYAHVQMGGVVGHRQVTDAYLAQLARRKRARLATFDEGLVGLHGDVAVLVARR
jgi:toxin-antitoxin system PIN domain toxin